MSEAAPAAPAPTRKARAPRVLALALAGALLCGGSAAAAWFYLGRDPAGEAKSAKAPKKAKKPLFTTLEPFTANLQDPRGERFAQIGVTLQFDDPEVEVTIKDRLPAVRNDILMLISSKQVEDLLSMDGKQALAQEIRWRAGRALGLALPAPGQPAPANAPENPIHEVLFSQFIVQ
ncbi:flagellar basal body-associated FliL family protein [Ramlibacter alkalitolerans]|uniref:Flagellar protein FliL n=1 Tax=Ramlibacter alkalitolerans TaxID=2039631 RepID=A0ABS1JKX2_9BURK|nr:flagellar basal body-associated FliL family protein [Ramlibacter alkalitolerans]MBL0424889.1 flagellar basal body-associated FliL family protein [Ramlibacter alkalitolerans]